MAHAGPRHVVAVVPTHNSLGWLDECLGALLSQEGTEMSVIVVDNGSTDGSPEHVRMHWPAVEVIVSAENLGYGAAINRGARARPDAHVLAVNADALLEFDCVREMTRILDENPRCGVVAPMLLEPNGRIQPSAHRMPTAFRLLGEALGIDRLPGASPALDYHHRDYRYDAPREVDWATGAVLLIRRQVWDAVQGFDPAYFLYAEEIDLQHRIRASGAVTILEPRARAMHHGGKRPIPAERFLSAHDGLERLLAPRGGARAAMIRSILILTALTRAIGWTMLAHTWSKRAPEARQWAAMFTKVVLGSARQLPASARRH